MTKEQLDNIRNWIGPEFDRRMAELNEKAAETLARAQLLGRQSVEEELSEYSRLQNRFVAFLERELMLHDAITMAIQERVGGSAEGVTVTDADLARARELLQSYGLPA